jgi:intracellular sulfur oxidation DsrE/DsrF family protein
MFARTLFPLLLFLLSCLPAALAGQKPDDHAALAGLKTARVIVDVRVADLDKLVFNLKLVRETFEGMVAQGVQPRMVIAFRGPGIGLLSADELDEEALDLIRSLKKKGVRFEVCAYALRVAKADPKDLVSEIRLVANVLNSMIGYQNKGYALVVLN